MNVRCQENGGNDDVILSSYQMIWKMFCVIKMGILLCFFFRRGKIFSTLEMPVVFCSCLTFKNVFSAKNCVTTFFTLHIFIEYVERLMWKKTPLKMLNQITEMKIHCKYISFSACLVVLFWLIFVLKNDKKKRWWSFLRHVSHSMKLN